MPSSGAGKQARPRRRARRWLLTGTAVVCAAGAAVALPAIRQPTTAKSAGPVHRATAPVVRTDLLDQENVDGKLGYAGSYTINAPSSPANGSPTDAPSGSPDRGPADGPGATSATLTWLPAEGQTIKRGQQVYRVDDRPVPLWYGTAPFWRVLKNGMTDGADVQELERNLTALGYGGGLTVDKHFSAATAQAVRKWQKAQGLPQTGTVAPGDVVLEPTAIRVTSVTATLGERAEGKILEASGTERVVTVDLPATRTGLARKGAPVQVRLPGGKTVPGHVRSIGTVAKSPGGPGQDGGQPGGGSDTATITVKVVLDRPRDAGTLDGAPVSVLFTSDRHKNVLAVPVTALLYTLDGSYAVRAVAADGTTRLVPVSLGLFTDGKVEVSGQGLHEGTKVEVPSE
ncbi:efflux RND transporter periplasmic adaptor subunit [Streptomyces sp. NPDC001450]